MKNYLVLFSWLLLLPLWAQQPNSNPLTQSERTTVLKPDADGDGTPDVADKCPNAFGEPEDGGCPNYTEWELEAIRRIQKATKEGIDSLNLSDLGLTRLPSLFKKDTIFKKLDLSRNPNLNLSFLQDLKQLTYLNLSWNSIQDVSFLQDLKQLTHLNLKENQIQDGSFLQGLKQLTHLELDHNQLQDGSFLKDLKQLRYLNLEENQLQNGSFIKDLKQLTLISLNQNRIQTFNLDLNELPRLKSLDLGGNAIQNIPQEVLKQGIEAIRAYQKKH